MDSGFILSNLLSRYLFPVTKLNTLSFGSLCLCHLFPTVLISQLSQPVASSQLVRSMARCCNLWYDRKPSLSGAPQGTFMQRSNTGLNYVCKNQQSPGRVQQRQGLCRGRGSCNTHVRCDTSRGFGRTPLSYLLHRYKRTAHASLQSCQPLSCYNG